MLMFKFKSTEIDDDEDMDDAVEKGVGKSEKTYKRVLFTINKLNKWKVILMVQTVEWVRERQRTNE